MSLTRGEYTRPGLALLHCATVTSDREPGAGTPGDPPTETTEEPTAGYRALSQGCALARPLPASLLEMIGEDRMRFLHGQTTCEVQGLTPGQGVYGFFLDTRGHVLSDAVISAHDDRLRIELPPGLDATLADHLRRYVVADRVEVSMAEGEEAVLVAGPSAADLLGQVTGADQLPGGWNHRKLTLDGQAIRVRAERRLGIPAWRLEVAAGGTIFLCGVAIHCGL